MVKYSAAEIFKYSPAYNIVSKRNFNVPYHTHIDYSEFLYVKKGCIIHNINNIDYRQEKGTFAFIREKDCHIEKAGNDLSETINIAVPNCIITEFLRVFENKTLYKHMLVSSAPLFISVPENKQDYFEETIRYLYKNMYHKENKVLLYNFLIYISFNYIINPFKKSLADNLPEWLADILNFIDDNINKELTIGNIVNRSGKTKEHLSRSFKKYLDITPSQYLNNIKLDNAGEYLKNTNSRIIEISYICGFSNLNYFNVLFKRKFMMTPGEFRLKFKNPLIHV
ncbi:MAG: hypothetical protein A2096_09960 [Spirochaetes bacterium GWF1_41_5]|nr:MAG: hypothetical protein A2096_09960 [Spirochaetes bacterium GWF1_41_5]